MKSKTIANLCVLFLIGTTITSCGGKKEESTKETTTTTTTETTTTETKEGDFAGSCTSDSKINVLIENYRYGVKDVVKYAAPNFEVKQATWNLMNDSTAELSLCNYTNEERAAGRTDGQVEISAKITAKKGKKIVSGTYGYMDYESGMAAMVTLNTEKGKVYFNGNDQGNLTITYFDKKHVCGTFDLAVDQPDNKTVGTVKLNGTFKVENK